MSDHSPAPAADVAGRQRPLPDEGEMTAVERFAAWHHEHGRGRDSAQRRYRDLLPLTPPGPGQQYAFEVDLDRCSGCKACVSACHSLNGLEEAESWRRTGLLVGQDWRHPFHQTVTTACHHCVDPACLKGCPALAYDKDPCTGIVRHLDDQCIGCQYCILMCPYEVPRFSSRLGIVRKCDLCSQRLARDEAPACVQACPAGAIRITVVEPAVLRGRYRGLPGTGIRTKGDWLPDAPDPAITLPATVYKTRRTVPARVQAADRECLTAQPPHTSLGFLLVLTQGAAGLVTFACGLSVAGGPGLAGRGIFVQGLVALGLLLTGLLLSMLHLGRPGVAWRALLGWKTSWLSREVIAMGLFAGLTGGGLWAAARNPVLLPPALATAALAGAWALFCSMMVYADTRREAWALRFVGPKFLGTAWAVGAALTLLLSVSREGPSDRTAGIAGLTVLGGILKLAADQQILRHLFDDDFSPLHKTALYLAGPAGRRNRQRTALTFLGAVVVPGLIWVALKSGPWSLSGTGLVAAAGLAVGLILWGELIEKRLFFESVQTRKMPGNP